MTSALRPALNRRRRVRHRIQTPAYASFTAESKGAILDLFEIIDISEEGVAIQCTSPLDADRDVDLCLDLSDCPEHIYTSGKVIWSNTQGRAGLHFSNLSPGSLFHLREWLFLNAMAGVANADEVMLAGSLAQHVPPRPSYTDTLAAVTAVQREVEGLGSDLAGALQLIAARAQTLAHASGAAIALATDDADFMDCRASSGTDAPTIGARLQVGSGFSGECVKTGQMLRCDDTELDTRVDRENCRVLGIRSILAVAVRVGEKSVGILEAFSPEPNAFSEKDTRVLQRLSETVLAAVNRAARAEDLPELTPEAPVDRFAPTPGSVLFASVPGEETKKDESDESGISGISFPRSHLIILICAAATIFMALGYHLAPWIQTKLQERGHSQMQTVLASSRPPKSDTSPTLSGAALETASFEQVRQLADKGDPAAENVVGLRYFLGDPKESIKQDEKEAARWFTAAAENGSVAAQSKLGFLYDSGRHGLPKDLNKAYLWTVIACGQPGEGVKDPAVFLSRNLALVLRNQMTKDQATAIDRQAQQWLQQHQQTKPAAGH
jgi:hypothetical protein